MSRRQNPSDVASCNHLHLRLSGKVAKTPLPVRPLQKTRLSIGSLSCYRGLAHHLFRLNCCSARYAAQTVVPRMESMSYQQTNKARLNCNSILAPPTRPSQIPRILRISNFKSCEAASRECTTAPLRAAALHFRRMQSFLGSPGF
jgi:hypothetical protein